MKKILLALCSGIAFIRSGAALANPSAAAPALQPDGTNADIGTYSASGKPTSTPADAHAWNGQRHRQD